MITSGASRTERKTRLAALALIMLGGLLLNLSAGDGIPAEHREGTYLYRFAMLQAGPGSMLELMTTLKKIGDSMTENGEERPIIVQHHQGDHWDLLVIYPLEGHAPFRVTEANGRRAEAVLAEIRPLLLWHEDLFVMGPEVEVLRGFLEGKGLVHFEMMQSLPGKYEDLVEERRMENTYNRLRGRGQTLIFTHAAGAAWDVVTLGAYKDWYEYADSAKIPREVSEKAARDAGFPSSAGVGLYMRTLISTHRDTLGPVIY